MAAGEPVSENLFRAKPAEVHTRKLDLMAAGRAVTCTLSCPGAAACSAAGISVPAQSCPSGLRFACKKRTSRADAASAPPPPST
jgi:hypothetical protein